MLLTLIDVPLICDCLHVRYWLQKSALNNVIEAIRSFVQVQRSLSPRVIGARRLIERFNQLVVILDSNRNIQDLLIISLLLSIYWTPLLPSPFGRAVWASLRFFLVVWRWVRGISLLFDGWMHLKKLSCLAHIPCLVIKGQHYVVKTAWYISAGRFIALAKLSSWDFSSPVLGLLKFSKHVWMIKYWV